MTVVLWVAVGALAVLVLGAWRLLFQLLRQQGRLLLRVEELEERVPAGPAAFPQNGGPRPEGIPLAMPFPPVRLRDLQGREVGLDDFRGKRVLTVHWDPGCGFCGEIAPEIAKLQGDLLRRNTELVLVSYGDAERNRRFAEEHGLDCTILLQSDDHPVDAFTPFGTPTAYLLDEKGRVAKPVAVGAREVPALVEEAAGRKRRAGGRSLADSRLEREGLKVGTPAPSFSLPDLAGRSVSLDEYQGRRVLLVFSAPECGPCNDAARELALFHREHRDELDLVMVSRGTVEENRRKAEEFKIDFPVVVQPGWRLSKQYGIFATPVAFLIDERGVIAHEVAKGSDEIVRLADEACRAREEAPMA